MRTSRKEIESLIYLMDDPDPSVKTGVEQRFRELGERAVPILDQVRSQSADEQERHAISEVLYTLTFDHLYEELDLQLERGLDGRLRLEEAVFLLSRIENPTLDTAEYRRRLDLFSADLAREIRLEHSHGKKMRMLLHYIFTELRFRGDLKRYKSVDNALIHRVIDRRRGIPLSLALIVLFLARRLDLPFYGVNMPVHFMLVYEAKDESFLIDPFDGGTLVTVDQCHYFLKKNGITPRPEHLRRCNERTILIRYCRNLIQSYKAAEYPQKAAGLTHLLERIESC